MRGLVSTKQGGEIEHKRSSSSVDLPGYLLITPHTARHIELDPCPCRYWYALPCMYTAVDQRLIPTTSNLAVLEVFITHPLRKERGWMIIQCQLSHNRFDECWKDYLWFNSKGWTSLKGADCLNTVSVNQVCI